jgi:hypothetical protein
MISVTYKQTATWTGNQIACASLVPSFELVAGRDMHERGGPTG